MLELVSHLGFCLGRFDAAVFTEPLLGSCLDVGPLLQRNVECMGGGKHNMVVWGLGPTTQARSQSLLLRKQWAGKGGTRSNSAAVVLPLEGLASCVQFLRCAYRAKGSAPQAT